MTQKIVKKTGFRIKWTNNFFTEKEVEKYEDLFKTHHFKYNLKEVNLATDTGKYYTIYTIIDNPVELQRFFDILGYPLLDHWDKNHIPLIEVYNNIKTETDE